EDEGRAIAVRSPNGLTVGADRERLEQALGNLVDNALRHGAGTVTLSGIRQNGCVELHVTDEGSGFPAGLLPTAFERFSRASRARSRGVRGWAWRSSTRSSAPIWGPSARRTGQPAVRTCGWLCPTPARTTRGRPPAARSSAAPSRSALIANSQGLV